MQRKFINPGIIRFKAYIKNTGNNLDATYVEFPYDLKGTYGVGNLVPIKATFDGHVVYQGSLAKMGGTQAMLLLRKDIRAQVGKNPGEEVDVIVELDDKPRQIEVKQDIRRALKDAKLSDYFDSLAYTHRREYITWIEQAKKPETRNSRIDKMCQMLAEKSSKK